ncbi:hypothetical protein LRS37_12900 [Neobacillus sedimentimangrovi]|uniref:Uncharacterized protein n=1 Tax=Neobacillus sedimentimangrovi TaxID=2699460 RepID=A0ABS8QKP5_9BACI|nr:hypothetical protein [Neobacillus sedimentimangrovi]MCD4839748.1 hypothetical protein [Neobacillus sedimentimangrovi]
MDLVMEVEYVRKTTLGGYENVKTIKRFKGLEESKSVADIHEMTEQILQQLQAEQEGFNLRRVKCQLDKTKFDFEEIQLYCLCNEGGYNITVKDMISHKKATA